MVTPVCCRQAALEAALQAQRVRCASLSDKLCELSGNLKSLSDGALDADKLRCGVGEVTRLLRQARLAETELQRVRGPHPPQPAASSAGLSDSSGGVARRMC
jgi:hypothetical protein